MEQPAVVVRLPREEILVAGIPPALRGARAAAQAGWSAVHFAGERNGFRKDWGLQLSRLGLTPAASPREGPVLVISGEGWPTPEALRTFWEAARSGGPARGDWEGRPVLAYHPAGQAFRPEEAFPASARRLPVEGWQAADDAVTVGQAERALFSSLGSESDGYIARFDRRISVAVSKRLLAFPITPNQITAFSLLLGLIGSWLLAVGPYPYEVLGAFLLWSCCILDGCDGEIARLKLLSSKYGGLFDVIADNVVHVAIFAAIPLNIRRNDPGAAFLGPGLLLLSGVLACMFSVWWLVLRKPQEERGALGLAVERIASRDFIYLVFALTVVGKLQWFLWAAAVGSHAFNLGLWALAGRARKAPTP